MITVWSKAEMLANAFTHIGPLTLLSKYVDVLEPYAQYPTKVTAYIGTLLAVNCRYRPLIMFPTTGCRTVAYHRKASC